MRNIEDHGRNMVVRIYPELQQSITSYYKRLAWRRKKRGEEVTGGELRSHSYALGRLLCWVATLSDADQARIQEEGGRLLDRLHELPEDYDGALPFGQRGDSVFPGNAVDAGGASGQDIGGQNARRGKRANEDGGRSKRTA